MSKSTWRSEEDRLDRKYKNIFSKEKELSDFLRILHNLMERGLGADIHERNLQALDFVFGVPEARA